MGKKPKQRGKPDKQQDTAADKPSAHLTKLQELVTRARQGDDAVVPQMREVLKHTELWREVGDMARHAQDCWLKLIAGDDHLVKESIRKSLTELRNELEEPGASRLEKLLIERILIENAVRVIFLRLHHGQSPMGVLIKCLRVERNPRQLRTTSGSTVEGRMKSWIGKP